MDGEGSYGDYLSHQAAEAGPGAELRRESEVRACKSGSWPMDATEKELAVVQRTCLLPVCQN